jgi:acyl-CoA oxidase
MDNGFLLFNKVKVPHHAMLAKYTFNPKLRNSTDLFARHSRVDPETNQYVKPRSATLVYGTMTWVRSTIVSYVSSVVLPFLTLLKVRQSGGVLARGTTIAIRYCAVRRQFEDRDAKNTQGETQVLDYTMVSYRLLTLLASAFALHFSGKLMMDMYQEGQTKLSEDTSEAGQQAAAAVLADLHATSCGLKSLASTIAADGLETARRACGGHGYSNFSGIGSFLADYLPNVTWEGDNYMLTQQVARYVSSTQQFSRSAN